MNYARRKKAYHRKSLNVHNQGSNLSKLMFTLLSDLKLNAKFTDESTGSEGSILIKNWLPSNVWYRKTNFEKIWKGRNTELLKELYMLRETIVQSVILQ